MKKLKSFYVIPTLLILTFYSCSKPVAPQYLGYSNFRLEKASFKNNVLATDIKLYNPNTYPLKIKSAAIDLFFNDKLLGHSQLDTLIVMPGKDTTTIPLKLVAQADQLLLASAKLLLNPNAKIKITGTARAGRGSFYINVPIEYEGVQKIEIF